MKIMSIFQQTLDRMVKDRFSIAKGIPHLYPFIEDMKEAFEDKSNVIQGVINKEYVMYWEKGYVQPKGFLS